MINKVRYILSGDFISLKWTLRQIKLIGLIIALTTLYLFFGYRADRQQQRYTRLKKEVSELRNEYIALESERSQKTMESHIHNELKQRGSRLELNKQPLIHIDN